MDDSDQPSATRAAIVRTSQACQRCRSLKTRCLPSSQASICQRCYASSKECNWAETPRRARKLRTPSRISQVEQKIDGLVASLVNPPVTQSAAEQTPPPPAVDTTSSDRLKPLPEIWKKQGTVAPGSWIPFPTSFEQSLARPEQGIEQARDDAETDRQFVESIRAIHRHSDNDDLRQGPEGLFQPSKRREAPIDDELVQQLLRTHEVNALLNEFRQMSASFPFVIVSSNTNAQELRDHQQQMSLDAVYRRELAQRTIISPRRTLGLVQSVLVYLSWYHFVFSHKTQQIFFLHHLVIGLSLDIGLHQDYQPLNFPMRPKPPPPSPEDQRERQRAFLGCYYLASMIAAGLQKPNLLKHTSTMSEWARNLKDEREYDSDETIGHLISLRQLDDQVQDSLFSGDAVDMPLSDARTLMHVRFLSSQLDSWRRESQNAGAQRLLELSSSFTNMLLHSVALRISPNQAELRTTESTQLDALLTTLEAGKRFFDVLLSFPPHEYHLISFSEWIRLPTVLMTVAKLCIPSDAHTAAGWDVKVAQDRVRLDLCLESLCYRMQQLSTYDKARQTHPDFWWAMRFINDLAKAWYIRRIKPDVSSKITPSGMLGQAGSEGSGPSSGVAPTPSADQSFPTFGMNVGSMSINMSASDNGDPFAFMKELDFDMEQFFDMGIWGDEGYNSMGFGGGMQF